MNPMLKAKQYRDKGYREWVAMKPCAACGRTPTKDRPNVPAHQSDLAVKYYAMNKYTGGKAMKAGDNLIIPLCNDCHAGEHQSGRGGLYGDNPDAYRMAVIINLVTEYYLEDG
jgi:hypothetical protein